MKKILFVLLVLTLVFGLCACAGTGTETNESNDSSANVSASESADSVAESSEDESIPAPAVFTVTVVDEDGNPVPGAKVQICEQEICFLPAVSDSEGKAVLNFEIKDGYTLKVAEVPEGYEYKGEDVALTAGAIEYTIELSKVTVE